VARRPARAIFSSQCSSQDSIVHDHGSTRREPAGSLEAPTQRDHVSVRKLPSGTVTLLFTDIEGSTRLLDELGPRYAQVLAEHRRTLREVFSRRGGVEVNTVGDSFFVAFSRASDAVLAAKGIQDALAAGPVHVRIGIHTGEPVVTGASDGPPTSLASPRGDGACIPRIPESIVVSASRRRLRSSGQGVSR
jgi:class 3 adenylate cyclase